MAQVVEVSGADVEDAVARALRQLGLSRDQVEIEVVREGKRGFLGFGSEESIVRVTARSTAVSAPRAGGDRGRRGGRGRGGPRPDQSGPPDEAELQRREGMARAAAEARDVADDDDDDEPPLRGDFASSTSRGGYSGRAPVSRDGGGRGGRGRGGAPGGGRPPREREGRESRGRGRGAFDRRPRGAIELPVRVPGAPDEGPTAPIPDAEDEIDLAGRTLRDLLTLLGLTETEISARDPETAGDGAGLMSQVFDVVGLDEETSDELGLLIGRRGETLQAVQYLLNVIVSSRYEGDQIFAVDVERYRRRREQALIELAQRVAGEVRATGDVITLEPMPPAERRIIHLTLQDEEGVATASVGDGPNRQVEIMPK
jgi:spoIIIJ-associated protein